MGGCLSSKDDLPTVRAHIKGNRCFNMRQCIPRCCFDTHDSCSSSSSCCIIKIEHYDTPRPQTRRLDMK